MHTHRNRRIEGKTYEVLESTNSWDLDVNIDSQTKEDEVEVEEESKPSLLKNWPLMSSIIVYCVFSFHDMAFTEVCFTKSKSDLYYPSKNTQFLLPTL